ncbi:MAG: hypothetical protein ACPGC5_00655 [Flavobacteriaceae bacterium]
MYAILKTVHSYWAYIVLIILTLATLRALVGFLLKKNFETSDFRAALFGLIVSHIQLLIGIILYFVSPWFDSWNQGMGAVMKDAQTRLYLVEHPTINILAIVFITLGWSLHKKVEEDSKKFFRIGTFYTIGFVLLLSRIPWSSWLG